MHDLIGRKAQHSVARAPEHPIAPCIRGARVLVQRPVNLHNQAYGRSEKVDDEAVTEHDLALEENGKKPRRGAIATSGARL